MKKIIAASIALLSAFHVAQAAPTSQGQMNFRISLQRTPSAESFGNCSIVFSPDGRYIASGGIDIWSSKGYLIRTIQGQGACMVQFTNTGKEIISATRRDVNVIDVNSGQFIRKMTVGTDGDISSLALSNDGGTLAIGTDEGAVEFWDYHDNKFIKRMQVTNSAIMKLAFFPDGKRLIYGAVELYTVTRTPASYSKMIKGVNEEVPFEVGLIGLNGKTGKSFQWRNNHNSDTFSYSSAADVIVVHDKATIWLLDTSLNVVKSTTAHYYGPPAKLTKALLRPDGKELAVVLSPGYSSSLIIYSLPGFDTTAENDIGSGGAEMAYTPDSRLIGMAGKGEYNRIFDPHTGAINTSLYKYMDMPVTADFSADGRHVASGGDFVSLWPIDGGEGKYVSGGGVIYKVLLPPDGRHIAVSRANGIDFVELDSGESRSFRSWQISPLAVSPDGKNIAYMPGGGLLVADVSSGQVLDQIPIKSFPVVDVSFSASGRYLVWGEGVYDRKLKRQVKAFSSNNIVSASRDFVAVAGNNRDIYLMPIDGVGRTSLHTGDRVTTLRFSLDGKALAAGLANGTIELWSGPGFEHVRRLEGHEGLVTDVEFSNDGRYLVSSSWDYTTRVWYLKNLNSYARVSGGGEWLIYTKDGYFDASPKGEALAAMVAGPNVFGMEQFALRNNRPDIILGRMGLGSAGQLAQYKSLYLKRLKRAGITEDKLSGNLHAPEATLLSASRTGKFLKVSFLLRDARFQLNTYNIYVNNVPLFGSDGRKISGSRYSGSEKIELTPGRNKIEISVSNSVGVESYRAQAYADNDEKLKTDLYFLAFGVSNYKDPALELSYADKDAKDLENTLLAMRSKYGNVYTKTFLNSDATAENILKSKTFLANAKTADTVVLFAAGHGGYSPGKDPKYYYLPYEADRDKIESTGVGFETIEAILDGIKPRKKLFLLDTCDSGELDEDTFDSYYSSATASGIQPRSYRKPLKKRGEGESLARPYLYDKNRMIYSNLSRRTGAIVFSASRAGEMSYESPHIQNGFFTHEVVAALSDPKADKDQNGLVSTKELKEYVSAAVAEQTKGLQHPTVDRDNTYQGIEFPVIGAQ